MVESCCCQRMPCYASSTDWQCFWYQPVCMRGASCLCVSKLGPSVGTFRSHTQLTTSEVELFRSLTPMSSTFGRVVLLSADAMPCMHSSTDWQCFWYQPVCMRGASCLCVSKLGPSVGTFRSHTQLTTSEVELFRSLTPMSSTFGRVVLLSADAMPCYVALALTGSAFGTSQCVCVAQAVCACPNWDHPSGHFAHTPN